MSSDFGNILSEALSAIGTQSFSYYAFASRATNTIGLDVSTYAAPVTIRGSLQAVPRNLYEQNGLDFNQEYVTIFANINVKDVRRDCGGDKIVYGSSTFTVLSATNWYQQDGWTEFLCAKVIDV